jgi:putative ABC transport system permease protein
MTSDLTLAWRNLRRNRRRTLLSAGGIGFAAALLVFVLSMQASQYQLMLRASVNSGTGYLQVQAKDYLDEPRMWLVVPEPAAAEAILRAEPRVTAVTSRSDGFSLLASAAHAQGALVIGVQPDSETRVSNIATGVRQGTFLDADDFDQGVIGALLARNLQVGVGDRVTILGSARDGSVAAGEVEIKGIFETGQPEFDRAMLYVPLSYFDEVFRMEGAVHRVIARCDSLWNLGPTAERVTAGLAGTGVAEHGPVALTWRALLPGVLEAIQLDMLVGGFMYAILVLVVACSILNTFVMAVFERTREFGVMMAIGTTPWRLVRVLLLESTMLTLLGIVGGIILGAIVTLIFADVGIYMGQEAADFMRKYGLPPRIHPELSVWSATLGPAAIFLLTILAASIPALRVRKMRPVEAMRAA